EQQRERIAILERQNGQRRIAILVHRHVRHVDTSAGKLLDHEVAELLVADTGQHGGLEPQPCATITAIGRATAKILGETGYVFQSAADLLGIEVDRRATETDQIKLSASHVCFSAVSPGQSLGPLSQYTNYSKFSIKGIFISSPLRLTRK